MVTCAVLLLCITQTYAALTLSNTLGSYMVLQRTPAKANIYGTSVPNDKIVVNFNNQNLPTVASTTGSWLVALPPTEAGGPYTITVTNGYGEVQILTDVLFGEVWFCSGQSNMQFTVDSAFNGTAEVQDANNYPDIRVFSVGQGTYSPVPLVNLNTIAMGWSNASAATIGAGNWSEFSAVCWFTGKYLYEQYKVPFGLISSNWGGTYIQAWSPQGGLKLCNTTSTQYTFWNADSALYNAMVNPFFSMTIKGVLWYQGENNQNSPENYTCYFPTMINWWRGGFHQDFTFLFVQLATIVTPQMRQAQLSALALPNVGYATAADLGDYTSPWGSIHPRNKQEVGRRLTLAARNIAYDETDVIWQGPTFQSANISVDGGNTTVTVAFTFYGPGGFVTKDPECPVGLNPSTCSNWQLYDAYNYLYNATSISVNKNVVTLQLTQATNARKISAVSYGWAGWPLMTLYSEQDLPAIPFYYTF
jgi:sialate O-acetylesterase